MRILNKSEHKRHYDFMIDFVKIEINSETVAEGLRKNPLLSFKNESDNETGELEKQRAKYKNLKFLIYPTGKTIIEGSIHKYHNAGEHNHNDFGFEQIVETIADISQKFGFDAKEASLHGLEFGVNIRLGRNPSTILNMIVCYGNNTINKMIISDGVGHGIMSKQSNYYVKIYNKSLQYGTDEHILRVEDKIIRMRQIANLGINTLHDLTDRNKVASLGNILFAMFDMLIIHEPVRLNELSKPELKLYEQAGNPRFWEGLNGSQRYKKKENYRAIIERYSTAQIKENIKQKVVEKWHELLKSGDNLTGIIETPKSDNFTGSIGGKHRYLPIENIVVPKRFCLSCGRDISEQKKGSKYCSEKLFGKGVKLCRNKESNPRHNPKNNFHKKVLESFNKYQVVAIPLFPNEQVFCLTPRQQELLINDKIRERFQKTLSIIN